MELTKCYNDFLDNLKFYCKTQLPKSLSFLFFQNFCSKTQADKVLWHLENFGTITNLQCHAIYGIRHAPSIIRQLRKRLALQGSNYRIENRTKHGCNRFGKQTVWDEYVLMDKNNVQIPAWRNAKPINKAKDFTRQI
jgi:hypothetical protein